MLVFIAVVVAFAVVGAAGGILARVAVGRPRFGEAYRTELRRAVRDDAEALHGRTSEPL